MVALSIRNGYRHYPEKAKRAKRMRQFGQGDIPQSTFIAALRMGDN
ncbi:MAG TPA: hypothetical protein VET89_03780 [Stellaceae bacterium]|nr:hypothetical protein [Stellaceae bacterium]